MVRLHVAIGFGPCSPDRDFLVNLGLPIMQLKLAGADRSWSYFRDRHVANKLRLLSIPKTHSVSLDLMEGP